MTINDSAAGYPQPPYPIHDSVKDKLHPEYVEFYNKYIINNQQVHYQPVEASRTSGTLIPGGGPSLPVGKTEDIAITRIETEGPDVMVRCFTPSGERPVNGWPVMVYYHGGLSISLMLRMRQKLTETRWLGSWKHQHREQRMYTHVCKSRIRGHQR